MRKITVILLALTALACVCPAAFAGEVPPITAAEFGEAAKEAHWIWSLLASDAAFNLLCWVLSSGTAFVVGFLKWQGSRKAKAIECLTAGVRESYERYVRQTKLDNKGEKLTAAQRDEAVRQAIEFGKRYAMTEGFDLLKVLAKDSLPVWVDSIVRRIKGEAALSKTPLRTSLPYSLDSAPLPPSV